MLSGAAGAAFADVKGNEGGSKKDAPARRLLFISGVGEWLAAWKAMVHGHKSQMVWFRWGWITIGRYMVVNDLKRERV
jgi:N-acetylglucosaminylphosphatidylinositol deacetylase